MLMPKRVKYRKQFRGRRKGTELRGATVQFGDFGLQALDHHGPCEIPDGKAAREMRVHVPWSGLAFRTTMWMLRDWIDRRRPDLHGHRHDDDRRGPGVEA